MRNLIKEEREHLEKLGYKFIAYEDCVSEQFRNYNYKQYIGEDEYFNWINDYVMEDGTVICLPDTRDGMGWMKYSVKYFIDKGVI